MNKAFIQTTRTTAIIDADTLIMDNLGGEIVQHALKELGAEEGKEE